jgi:hypothetical protein
MKALLTLIALAVHSTVCAQKYVLPNEEVVFHFQTTKGREVYLVKDRSNAYLVYRYGTKQKIELEYPARTAESWKRFVYSYYLRGGGIKNAGMDLNYLSFSNQGVQYILYHNYYAEGDILELGIRVKLPGKKDDIIIRGRPVSQKGTLIDFRFNELVEIGEELYD